MRHFFTVWLISLNKNWSDFHENFVTDISLDKEVPTKFWKTSGSRVQIRNLELYSGCGPYSPWRKYMYALSECSCYGNNILWPTAISDAVCLEARRQASAFDSNKNATYSIVTPPASTLPTRTTLMVEILAWTEWRGPAAAVVRGRLAGVGCGVSRTKMPASLTDAVNRLMLVH